MTRLLFSYSKCLVTFVVVKALQWPLKSGGDDEMMSHSDSEDGGTPYSDSLYSENGDDDVFDQSLVIPTPARAGSLKNAVEEPICLEGKAVPRLYLLGHQKCATTTAALAYFEAGLSSPLDPPEKEIHAFNGFFRLKGHSDSHYPSSKTSTEEQRQKFLNIKPWMSCGRSDHGTLFDATPSNVKYPGLPSLMSNIYGKEASRLGFVIHLRDPLARVQSEWYMQKRNHGEYAGMSFAEWMSSMEPKLQKYKDDDYKDMELDGKMSVLYRSLYSKNIEPWFKEFDPSQFVIVPMKHFVKSVENQQHTAGLVADKFKATVVPWMFNLTKVSYINDAGQDGEKPPTLEEELGKKGITRWNENFFNPQMYKLAGSLAKRVISVSGFLESNGIQGDQNSLYGYLLHNV